MLTPNSLLYIIYISCIWFISGQITTENIDDLREEIRDLIDDGGNNHQLLARIVRLAFHDCSGPFHDPLVSGCNGCVDFTNPDHAGMNSIINPLENVYEAWSGDMSRADFWATAATIALEYASELDTVFPDDSIPAIPYYFGRTDCDTSPNTEDTKQFAQGGWGWDAISTWFEEHLDFNDRETVTIIGAHTLGKCHQQFSGYSSERWKRQGPDMLNNVYYTNLLDLQWEQLTSPRGLYEWRVDVNGRDVLMLNADMCLVIDIDDNFHPTTPDRVTCEVDDCPESEVRSIVQEFADDNQLWLNEFVVVFERMILTGYDKDELEKVDANPFNALSVGESLDVVSNLAFHGKHGGDGGNEHGGYSIAAIMVLVCIFAFVWLSIGFFIGHCMKPKAVKTKVNI